MITMRVRECLLVLGVVALNGCAAAQAGSSAAPAVPRQYDVRSFGAKGDGRTIDSDAINRAIDAAATAGGGIVYLGAGIYASYSIHLKSHVGLYLDQGAVLLAADTAGGKGYDPGEPGPGNNFQDFGHSRFHNSLIWGENLVWHDPPATQP